MKTITMITVGLIWLVLLCAGPAVADEEQVMTTSLPQWQDYMALLSENEKLLDNLPENDSEAGRQAVYLLMVKAMASGLFTAMSDPDYPDLVPTVNTVLNTVGVNPDFVYAYSKLDGRGVYRLSGYRGDGLFLLIDFMAGGLGVLDTPGPSIGILDVDEFTIGPDGEFDILLSTEKPADYTGDWFPLDAGARTLNVRQASYNWGKDNEARIALERVDIPHHPKSLTTEETAERLKALMSYPAFYAGFTTNYIRNLRDGGFINKLQHDDWAGRGGVSGQHYYQGIFQLEKDHVLVLETEMPETVRYWNIQLADALWNSVNWMNHQSSLNGGQALLDSDGRFRAVIALEDPGVANWLDPAGQAEGTLMLRWNGASSGPVPILRSVHKDKLLETLPADTVTVTAEERDRQLRERRRNVQLRRRW